MRRSRAIHDWRVIYTVVRHTVYEAMMATYVYVILREGVIQDVCDQYYDYRCKGTPPQDAVFG